MFWPFFIVDCQEAMVPPPVECVSVAAYQSAIGSLQSGVRYGDLVLRFPGQTSNLGPAEEQPDPSLPIDVQMTGDNQGEGGQWYQTFVLTIKPAGTLAHASTIVYGDESHVSELFGALQKRYPNVTSPARVQAGHQIEITVDASRTHVLKKVIPGGTKDAQTRLFFNGVKETFFGRTNSAVIRTVEFPADAPVDSFTFKRGEQELSVPRGNKFVEYRYEQGDSFEETVKTSYGILSSRAIQDFERQTRWPFNRWPPANGETAEAIISTTRSYADEAFEVVKLTLPDPQANARLQELLDSRAKAGVYPIKKRPDGVIYRVTVVDSTVTARQVSKLLYNSDSRYLELAEAAGVPLEESDPAKLPANFDVPLIGRSFDIHVDFADENYVLDQRVGGSAGERKITRLLNGTVIEEYEAAEKGLKGMHQTIYYPGDYRRLVYKPDDALVSLFDFVYFTMNLGQVDDDEDRRAFVAAMLWSWLRDIPRSPGDVAEELTLRDVGKGKLLEVLIWRREKVGLLEMALYRWWTVNPCVALTAIVFGASVLFMVLVIIIRKAASQRSEG